MPLQAGDAAPSFSLPVDGGGTLALGDFLGRKLVLYAYPKDDTSGCTLEAKDFNARQAEFAAAGTAVVGISPDPVAAHDRFKAKHGLAFPLLADEAHGVLEAYGIWIEKSMYGRRFMGVERATFLIDANGRLARIWRKVRVPGHVEEVLSAARDL